VIGTLAVDGSAVTFGTARRGLGGPLLRKEGQRLARPQACEFPESFIWSYNLRNRLSPIICQLVRSNINQVYTFVMCK